MKSFKMGLYIRRWEHGDKILLSTSKRKVLISDLFINNKLSKVGKLIQPIIVNKMGCIVWIPGLAHAKLQKYPLKQKNKVIEWMPG